MSLDRRSKLYRRALGHDASSNHIGRTNGVQGSAEERVEVGGPIYRSRSVFDGFLSRMPRDGNGVADGAEQAVAATSSSSGSPLPGTLMRKFESSLGADLSGVRVHTGAESAAANDAVGARAYTVGSDIHFGAGQYDPSSSSGENLIAHEVAHTVQQSGGGERTQFKLAVSAPGDAFEAEADVAAAAMVSGTPATVSGASGGLARKEKEPLATSNDTVDVKKIDEQIGTTHQAQAKLAATATNGGVKIGEMIGMLTGPEGVLAAYDELAERYGDAREKLLAALAKHDETKNKANEMVDKLLEKGVSKAMALVSGPHGLAIKETLALTGIAEMLLDKALDLPVSGLVELSKVPPSNEAAAATHQFKSKELKQLQHTRDVLALTAEIGKRGGSFAQLGRLGPLFSKTIENLTALRNKGGTAAGTIMSPSECERTVKGFAAITAECARMEKSNNNMYARVKEMLGTARKQLFLTSNEAALRRMWSEYLHEGGEAKPVDGLFGEEQVSASGQGDGHHNEIQANLQVGRTAVAKTEIVGVPKGAVSVASQTFQARSFGNARVAAGDSCNVVGVVPQTPILIVEPIATDPSTTSG